MLRFIAHHLWDEAERAKNPDHGMPEAVAEALRAEGRLRVVRPACARHRSPPPRAMVDPASLARGRRAVRQPFDPQRLASLHSRRRSAARAKEHAAITRDILDQLLATCGRGRAVDFRDRALLLLAFGSGGRRRSEIARLRVEDLEEREPVPADPSAPDGPTLPVLALRLRRTKTSSAEAGESALVIGRPVEALRAWLEFSKIDSGPVFRRIDKWGTIGATALDPQSVNAIIKIRCAAAGLEPALYSAHGLRSGYLTQAAREGVPLPEAMQQSQHRSVQQAARYYNETQIARGRAARLG